jgi:hypothetical protein
VARAEAGDFPGAIADLQSFVEGLGDPRAMQVQERVQWIDFLKKNQNPFTPAVLERLRKTEMGSWPQ